MLRSSILRLLLLLLLCMLPRTVSAQEPATAIADDLTQDSCVGRPAGLAAWWPLDEPTGTTAFDLATDNPGQYRGGPQPEPAVVLGGLSFDGIDDYVEVPDASALDVGAGSFTLMAFAKTTRTAGVESLLDKRTTDFFGQIVGYHLFLFNGRLGVQLADGDFTNYVSSASVADGSFHHLAVTVNHAPPFGNPAVTFYVDGVAAGSRTITQRFSLTNDSPLRLGVRSTALDGFFDGILDEVALFHRALSPQEVHSIAAARHAGMCKCAQLGCRPLAWWPFDEATGNLALDIAGHTLGPHHAILEGPTRVVGKVGGAVQFNDLDDLLFSDQTAGLDLDPAKGGAFTVKAWVRTSAPSGPIVNNRGGSPVAFGWALALQGGVPAFQLLTFEPLQIDGGPCTSQACAGLNLADDQWHLVGATVTYDPGGRNLTIRLYADGKLLQTLPAVDVPGSTIPGGVSIGRTFLFENSEFFAGKIDEVQIFDQALTPAEFARIFAAGSAGECKPAVPPQICGLTDSENCPASQFCDFLAASQCGALSLGGICRSRPEICVAEEILVCGCDGQTYSSACVANWNGVAVAFDGPCP